MVEVGMYAYVKGECRYYGIGIIRKFEWGIKEEVAEIQFKHSYHSFGKSEVIGSFDITDLIEVGDVIKYEIKTSLETSRVLKGIMNISDREMLENIKNNYDYAIKSIVTHEQFESMKHEVE